jgi:hypothetical protein
MGGWSLLTDTDAMKRAGVPILRLMNVLVVLFPRAQSEGRCS